MTHANAPLTPEGRRRLARLVVEEGMAHAPGGRTLPGLAGHRQPVGGPVPGRPAHGGPLLPPPPTTAQGGWQGALSGASSP